MDILKPEDVNFNDLRVKGCFSVLSVAFEEIYDYLSLLQKTDNSLGTRVSKYGDDEESFSRWNETLQTCAKELQLPIAPDLFDTAKDQQDFDDDMKNLHANLKDILEKVINLFGSVEKAVEANEKLLEQQQEARSHYTSQKEVKAEMTFDVKAIRWDEVIGRGGFGVVWKARYKGEYVAIKKVASSNLTEESIKSLKLEAEFMKKLSHPRIVTCLGVLEYDDNFCVVMELCSNGSLSKYLAENEGPSVPWEKRIDFAIDIAAGMNYLHKIGVIHRDLKLGNVVLDINDRGKITDFGLSVVKSESQTSMKLDESGTPQYMAPESFGLVPMFSTKSDVYAFSIILWELSHWKTSYYHVSPAEIKGSIRDGVRLPIADDVPLSINSLIVECWQTNPKFRPSFADVLKSLKLITEQVTIPKFEEIVDIPTALTSPSEVIHYSIVEDIKKAASPTPQRANYIRESQKIENKVATSPAQPRANIHRESENVENNRIVLPAQPRANSRESQKFGSPIGAPVIRLPSVKPDPGQTAVQKYTATNGNGKSYHREYDTSVIPQRQPLALLPSNTAKLAVEETAGLIKTVKKTTVMEKTPPKRNWTFTHLTPTKKMAIIGLAIFLILAALIAVIAVVAISTGAKGLNLGETSSPTTTLQPTCNVQNAVQLQPVACRTSSPVVSVYAGISYSSGNTEGLRTSALLGTLSGLAFHPDGYLLASDQYGLNNITGNYLYNVTGLNFNNNVIKLIAVDSAGVIYMPIISGYIATLDTRTSKLSVFAGNVSSSGSIDSDDLLKAKFQNPIQTVLHNDLLYVLSQVTNPSSATVRVMDPCPLTKNPGVKTILKVNSTYGDILSMAIDSVGDIYLSSSNNCIHKFLVATGNIIMCFAGTNLLYGKSEGYPGIGTFSEAMGIVFDGCDNLFVADYSGGLRIVNKTGYIRNAIPGSFENYITYLTFSSTGDLYGAYSNYQIKKISFS